MTYTKKYGLILILIFTIICLGLLNYNKVFIDNEKEEQSNNNSSLAIFVEGANGYENWNDNELPNEEYVFNENLSGCENGGTLTLEKENDKLLMKTNISDKCYAYFDFNKSNYVKDLSGNNNHGKLENIVSWDSDGITTSNATQVGYVDCGLIGHDFNNTITIITKLRWNELQTIGYSSILGNIPGSNRDGFVFSMLNSGNNELIYRPFMQVFNAYYSDGWGVYPTTMIEKDIWYTLIGIYDGTKMTFCINDNCFNTNVTNGLAPSNNPIYLGNYPLYNENNKYYPNNSDYGYNTFSNLIIYDRAISEEEKNYFVNNTTPTNKDDLLLWYDFTK